MTQHPLKAILRFSIPMMIGNLFQQLYTMADSVIVGRFVGEEALAAVGASYALTTVFIAIAIGGGAGATVITSHAFGAGDFRSMKESISTSLLSFAAASLVLSAIGFLFSPSILQSLNTPQRIMADADAYLRIYFLGLPFLFMYNILSSVFNSLGRSSIPLCLLIFSSVLNVMLDIVAVAGMGMGVVGAAWATLVAQALSALLSFAILIRLLKRMDGTIGRLFSFGILKDIAGVAIPSILQQSTISIGMMLVQSVVNLFGAEVLAGYSAAIRVDSLATVPIGAIGNAMSPYTAQNLGAGKRARVPQGFRAAVGLVLAFGAAVCLILELFDSEIISLFLGEEGTAAAYSTGEQYLSFLGWFYWILGLALATGGILRGAGDMKLFAFASMANLAVRVLVSMLLAPTVGVSIVWWIVPVGWSIYFLICLAAYTRHRWT